MANDKFGYALDRTDELWQNAEGETREEAAAFAFREEPDAEVVYVCNQIVSYKAHLFQKAMDINRLLDECEESACEDASLGHHEDNVFDHSKRSIQRLGELLDVASDRWLEEFPGPRIWTTIGAEITEHHRSAREGAGQ